MYAEQRRAPRRQGQFVVPDVGIGDLVARFAVDPEGFRTFIAATAKGAGALRASHIKALLANDFRPLLATGRPDDSLLLAAAGAELAAGNGEGVRSGYVAAARLAERTGNTCLRTTYFTHSLPYSSMRHRMSSAWMALNRFLHPL